MTNNDLHQKRFELLKKASEATKKPPLLAASDIKVASMMMVEIVDELVTRELAREGAPHE